MGSIIINIVLNVRGTDVCTGVNQENMALYSNNSMLKNAVKICNVFTPKIMGDFFRPNPVKPIKITFVCTYDRF